MWREQEHFLLLKLETALFAQIIATKQDGDDNIQQQMVNVELEAAHRAAQLWFRFHFDQVNDIWITPILCSKMVRLDNFMKYPVTLPVLDDAHHRFEILNSSLRPSWSIKRLVFLDKVAHPLPQCRILPNYSDK